MMPSRLQTQKGAVILVAMCFVAVLGISLAGYVSLCSRTMQLSNRTYHTGLSRQLAETGLEEALRAFNQNNWADWTNGTISVNWTLDTTNKRATATVTIPTDRLGQGATGSVKIRVDNYDAHQLDSTWRNSTSYRVNDMVNYSGTWYRCVRAHSNRTPAGIANMAYWVPDPIPAPLWNSTATYRAQDVVYYTTTDRWYRCILAPTANQVPTNVTYWTLISAITVGGGLAQNLEVNWDVPDWWYYTTSWIKTPPTAPIVSWTWRQSYAYAFNDMVYYGNPGVWYRCISPHTSSAAILPTNPTYWQNALTGMWGWSSTLNYRLGDVVYSGSSLYRCIQANTNKTPASNPTQWSSAPLYSSAWDSVRQYNQNDTVRYEGVWYLCLNSNSGQVPPTFPATNGYWVGADTSNGYYQWSGATAYAAGDYKCYGGVWYKCIASTTANAGHSPNNTTYWTASWANSWGVTTGAPVVYAEGTVNIAGSPSIRTQLRAPLATSPLFPNAVAANTSTITANSGGTVDSYDSTSGTYASQVNSTTNYSAVVASAYSAGTAITLSSTAVKGYAAAPSSSTTPYAPLFSSGGSVKGYSSPGSPNIDLTRLSRSPYIPEFDTLPGGTGGVAANWSTIHKGTALSLSSTMNLGTPGAVTPSRYFHNGNLTISDSATVQTLNINGPVILYINGDLILDGDGTAPDGVINITSTGSAEIHIADSLNIDINSAGINNTTRDPKKLILICDTASSSSQYYSDGGVPFYGTIYIPYSTNSSGFYNNNNNVQIYGAISANKVTYSGANLNVHYDTSLRYATFGGVDQPHIITQWRELTEPAERATMP